MLTRTDWINQAPIYKREAAAFLLLLRGMKTTLEDQGQTFENSSSIKLLTIMIGNVEEPDGSPDYFAYMIDGQAVALMILSLGMKKEITDLVSLPGHGRQMCEFGMNLCNGRAELAAFDAAATGFWTAMGAVMTDKDSLNKAQGGGIMTLECKYNSKWLSINDIWRLRKYITAQDLMA